MGIIIRQGLKYSTVAYVGVLIGAFNTVFLFPNVLSLEQYGLMRLVQENGLFIAAFVQLGAANIADKFIPVFRTEDKKNKGLLFFLLIYPLIGFTLFCLVFLVFQNVWLGIYQDKSPGVNIYFYYFIPLVFFMMYQSILEAYSRVHLRIVVPGIFRDIILKLLTTSLVILFVLEIISFYQLIVCLIVVYGIIVFLLFAYLNNLKVLHLKPDFRFFNRKLMKEMFTYGVFILLGGAGTLIVSKIDFLMLGALAGEKEVAIYTIAFFIATIIEIPRRAIAQISTPILSQAWLNNDINKIEEIYKKSAINQIIIGALLFLGIWCNADSIFNLIPNGEIYREGKYVILFIGLARLFDMATGVNGEIILQSRYYRFNLISVAILAVLIVGTSYIFIPIYGINGAAFATALSVFLYNIIKYLFLWIKFRIQPFNSRTLAVVLIATVTFFAASLIPPPQKDTLQTILNIFIRSVVITVLFSVCIFAFRISEEANQLLKTGYSQVRNMIFKKVNR